MPSESFGKKRTNEQNLVCKNCLPKKAKNSRNQTAAEQGISTLSLDEAYERLPSSDLNATVVVDPDDPVLQPIRHIEYVDDRSTLLPHVSNIAAQLWSRSGYRFIYHSSKPGPRSSSFNFFCANDIERARKSTSESRDRESMARAPCGSLLSFSFAHIARTLTIKAQHRNVHEQYADLRGKPAIRDFISRNIESCPSKLCQMIKSCVELQEDAQTLTEHQVRYVWHSLTSRIWQRHSDALSRPECTQAKNRGLRHRSWNVLD